MASTVLVECPRCDEPDVTVVIEYVPGPIDPELGFPVDYETVLLRVDGSCDCADVDWKELAEDALQARAEALAEQAPSDHWWRGR